jgi:hypothetical protein
MILPAKSDRGTVVFWLFPSLSYNTRMAVSFALIAVGLVLQLVTGSVFPGVALVAGGNLLLVVKGYDNRVDAGAFDAGAQWERVGVDKLQELKALDKKMRRWDRSLLDISNPLGVIVFILLLGALASGIVFGVLVRESTPFGLIVAVDAAVLFLPHWFTGIRSILRKPGLLVRVKTIEAVLDSAKRRLEVQGRRGRTRQGLLGTVWPGGDKCGARHVVSVFLRCSSRAQGIWIA